MTTRSEQLDAHLHDLAALEQLLAASLADSDPVLWAAHESLLCLTTLLTRPRPEQQGEPCSEADLSAALAQLRSATIAVRFAVSSPARCLPSPAAARDVPAPGAAPNHVNRSACP